MAFLTIHLKEQRFVADDVGMTQLFDVNEILLQKDDMFPIYLKGLGCKELPRFLAVTFSDYSMGSFPNFFAHGVVVIEKAIVGLI